MIQFKIISEMLGKEKFEKKFKKKYKNHTKSLKWSYIKVICEGSELDDVRKCANLWQRLNLTRTAKKRRTKCDAHKRNYFQCNCKLQIAGTIKICTFEMVKPHLIWFEDFSPSLNCLGCVWTRLWWLFEIRCKHKCPNGDFLGIVQPF